MKRISILLFSVLFSITAANAQGKSIKDFIDYHKKFKKQAESFADKHEWVSFKYKNIHYYDDKFSWEGEHYYTFYDFSYENRQNYIDSIFNYNNKEYEKYSRYDVANPEPYHSFDTIVTDKLLDFPIVNLKNDTTTLREQNSWVLLYSCIINIT